MKLWMALRYFAIEASQSLVRSWKVSLVAVLTMGVSLFLCGGFFLVFRNVSETVRKWRSEVRVTVYLHAELEQSQIEDLRFTMGAPLWVSNVATVDAAAAALRFRETFPRLATLTDEWAERLFPSSLEASVDPERVVDGQFHDWIRVLEGHPAALLVDADREWLNQLSAALTLLKLGGLALGMVFLAAAALTTASILRLIAHLHSEETAIMRLVGATEFFVRGPFYMEGLIQGLTGAVLAISGLAVAFFAVLRDTDSTPWTALFFSEFLSFSESMLLLFLGAGTGMIGAVLSLRRESLAPNRGD